MIPLRKITSSQFLLLHADQSVGEVRQLLADSQGTHIVALRREGAPQYFLFKIGELRNLVKRAVGAQTLEDILAAAGDNGVDAVDADVDAETGPDC
jgi:hypothetical protein